jgi:pyruvate dehydrogenase E2 component (dihydrolipoamide acetyltransferase)
MSTVEVRVPDMGNFDSVTVIEVLVKVGDSIDIDTPLATLETDKATMDVPSTAKGVVEKIHIAKGGSVSAGALIVTLKGEASAAAPAPSAAASKPTAPAVAAAPAPAAAPQVATSIEVRVPDMGSFDSVGIVDVLVKPGDTIDIDTPLATLETDKATMDVPSTAKGVVEKVHIAKGGKVAPGDVVVTVKGFAAAAAAPKSVAAAPAPAPARSAAPAPRRVVCRPSTKPASAARMPRRRCASSRVNWVWTSAACAAAVKRAASSRTTSKPS